VGGVQVIFLSVFLFFAAAYDEALRPSILRDRHFFKKNKKAVPHNCGMIFY
jgi:hypothetical protein